MTAMKVAASAKKVENYVDYGAALGITFPIGCVLPIAIGIYQAAAIVTPVFALLEFFR
jgi:hypothetical protein